MKNGSKNYVKNAYRMISANQSLDAAAIADVTLLKEGRHPPGKIYSLMKSELLLYSSYLSSGIDINCTNNIKKYMK